jgi:dienelactone hydrolase
MGALIKTIPSRVIFSLFIYASFTVGSALGQEDDWWPVLREVSDTSPLPGTDLLRLSGDIASQLVAGVDRFLLGEIGASVGKRSRYWDRNLSSVSAYVESVSQNRERFRRIIGMKDPRPLTGSIEFYSPDFEELRLARGEGYTVYTVRWPAFRDVHGEGLLIYPDGIPQADVVAVPDAELLPEELAGLVPVSGRGFQYAAELAQAGCRVLVPTLINRSQTAQKMSFREWLYRPAFELGRHLIGYEVLKILAGIDYFESTREDTSRRTGVIGWGEGGLLALYSAAVDQRITSSYVSGYFGSRQNVWQEPAYRNVFGLLEEYGDAEIATLIAPRQLIVESSRTPELVLPEVKLDQSGRPVPGRPGGKPGRIKSPDSKEVNEEVDRANALLSGLQPEWMIQRVSSEDVGCSVYGLSVFLRSLGIEVSSDWPRVPTADLLRCVGDPNARHQRNVHELVEHNEWALRESSYAREEFMRDLDLKSLASFVKSQDSYREVFRHEVIGHFDHPLLPPRPRTRKYLVSEGVTSWEVVLDVFPDVIAFGVLTLPNELIRDGSERRPVVICQHGLEGTPQQAIGWDRYPALKAFATRLAERGFITFAPQNLYRGYDKFRTLQFKGNAIKKTLFSVMVPQHQQIVNWLSSLEFVDPKRIAFYGLSYGGKAAMRIPPLVSGYCLSICSADFNEWVWKNSSTRSKYSYAQKREYEIFEWNLGNTFNYAEMAALIAPRPFMVERGHFDGVAPDEKVAHEYAKVRRLYNLLGIGDRTEIEWFVGPHSINGEGTYRFLHEQLNWPEQ